MMRILLALAAFALVGVSCITFPPFYDLSPGPCHIDRPFSPNSDESQIVGALGLQDNISLQFAAIEQAEYEASQDTFGHVDGLGRHSWERVTACGYPWGNELEEIPWGGDGTPQQVIETLQQSTEWSAMSDAQWTDIGVGSAQSTQTGTWYWVIVEARQ